MSQARQLCDFLGRWSLSRQITHANQPPAEFTGQAEWRMQEGRALYREEGVLSLAGQPPMQAMRHYIWDEGLNVFFEDGRFFHTVSPLGGEARHWCDPDAYWVVYDFAAWPEFRATWRVKGPRKDYVMRTKFSRCSLSDLPNTSGETET